MKFQGVEVEFDRLEPEKVAIFSDGEHVVQVSGDVPKGTTYKDIVDATTKHHQELFDREYLRR